MKRTNLINILLLIAFTLNSCSNRRVTEPEQIGKKVFEILKTISTNSKQDYIDNFLSIEEIRELGKNEEVVKAESTRNKMTSMLKEKWIDRITGDYNHVKKKGASSGIVWQEIKYLDFVYEIKEEEGLKGTEGELYFKHNDDTYRIEISAIWNGNEYQITEIEDLFKK